MVGLVDYSIYVDMMRKISDAAADAFQKTVFGEDYKKLPLSECSRILKSYERNGILGIAQAIVTKYGEAASALACEMFDRMAEWAKVNIPPAEPAEPPSFQETAKAINGTAKTENPSVMGDAVSRLVKKTGETTTLKNAQKYGAQCAWVSHGDTCPFCIMLASRGWQAAGKGMKDGEAVHIHGNCDCTWAVRFNGNTQVKGYDPDDYLEIYNRNKQYKPGGGLWTSETLNAMRREMYEDRKDEINAQKREAYAKAHDNSG